MPEDSRSSLRILVVDDDPDTVKVLGKLLSMNGYSATGADCHDAAVAAVKAVPFDLMLCDLSLPDLDGYAVLRDVLAIRPMRAIAITGYGSSSDVAKVTAAGFDDYFLKPYDFDKLFAAIQRMEQEIAVEREQSTSNA